MHTTLALFSLGGGEIILILLLVPALVIGAILLIVGASRKTSNSPRPTALSPLQSGEPEKLVKIKRPSCGKLNGQDANFCQECGRKL
jgi:hypothetical protein